jgi:hypothetical protein
MLARSSLVLLLALAGCTIWGDDEPDCDPGYVKLRVDQPEAASLDFGDVTAYPPIWVETAVDGTEQLEAGVVTDCGSAVAGHPLTVAVTDESVVTAEVTGDGVLLHAHAEGTTSVQISSGLNYVWNGSIVARPATSVQLAAREVGVPDAFLAGATLAIVGLHDSVGAPLWDDSMSVTGAPAGASPDELAIASLPAGDHALQITAAGATWPATLRIVDTIDDVVARDTAITITTTSYPEVCFFAHRAGQVVAGVPWTFSLDGHRGQVRSHANCIQVGGDAPGTSYTVTAKALGHSATTHVTIN